ncbi:Saccharopine dehydrogenase [Conoideocrella luteorostrata]|uniref:Saccharopine dehydrogenase n=1 Tax=Conoideocrella luteorostrata TaxID=1105319 RepID=A0AAJ0CHV9_9HYPO|nr:Saccharopine dehydrogenase [Conoideocrella luteorostrata]
MSLPVIHLRSETKPKERRSPLSPETAKALLDAGYKVKVEDWADRIYKIDEFRAVGAEIVPAGSWRDAPKEDIILGLKEIESDGSMFYPVNWLINGPRSAIANSHRSSSAA